VFSNAFNFFHAMLFHETSRRLEYGNIFLPSLSYARYQTMQKVNLIIHNKKGAQGNMVFANGLNWI